MKSSMDDWILLQVIKHLLVENERLNQIQVTVAADHPAIIDEGSKTAADDLEFLVITGFRVDKNFDGLFQVLRPDGTSVTSRYGYATPTKAISYAKFQLISDFIEKVKANEL